MISSDFSDSGSFLSNVNFQSLTYEGACRYGEAMIMLGDDVLWENWTMDNLLDERTGKWLLSLVALINDSPIAYAVASRQDKATHLHQVIVGSKWRGYGIGGYLLNTLSARSKQMGLSKITLKVYKENHKAIQFYLRHGFCIEEDSSHTKILKMALSISDCEGN